MEEKEKDEIRRKNEYVDISSYISQQFTATQLSLYTY